MGFELDNFQLPISNSQFSDRGIVLNPLVSWELEIGS